MSRPAFLFSVLLLIAAAACSSVQASKVLKCKGSSIDVTNKVRISVCEEPPCQLRKRAVPEIRIAFRPDHDINNLVTSVQAQIGGIPFPFIGVDGTSACGKLFKSDGKTKADCPLKKGQDYFYVNSFKVYDQYPKVKLHIRWALRDPNANKMVSCFELPAKITN
uniref:Niemann-Pick type C2 protein d n=1 Tax=Adelphocoris lineolatus TaxID=236346 RepID=A0A346RVH7_ADELI|nr:Niemann-Pick type C2 protein d [Adelphocoris lineolatus]